MSEETVYPPEFLERLASITNKRAKAVVDHIVNHGHVSTEELSSQYGYQHPPRAARDVRDLGIPLITIPVKAKDGRSIGAYKFGDISGVGNERLQGRGGFTKKFRTALFASQDNRCAICSTQFEDRYLQVDHRIPYGIAGDGPADATGSTTQDINDYMGIDGSCNRSKSWSCEHCPNWLDTKDPEVCTTCYWAHPENYIHIATVPMRRLDMVWNADEVATFDGIKSAAEAAGLSTSEFIKQKLRGVV